MVGQKWTFYFEGKGLCSVNSAYDHNRQKTNETMKWLYDVKVLMLQQKKKIEEIKRTYSPYEHFVMIDYYWFCPKDRLFMKDPKVKQQRISRTSGDVGNFAKIPDDYIMNRGLGIDDSNLCREMVWKLPISGKKNHFKAVISIYPLHLLYEKAAAEIPEFWR